MLRLIVRAHRPARPLRQRGRRRLLVEFLPRDLAAGIPLTEDIERMMPTRLSSPLTFPLGAGFRVWP